MDYGRKKTPIRSKKQNRRKMTRYVATRGDHRDEFDNEDEALDYLKFGGKLMVYRWVPGYPGKWQFLRQRILGVAN